MQKVIVPPRVLVSGDKAAARGYLRYANSQMGILKNLMSFQKLNEGVRLISPIEGVYVRCFSSFSIETIQIHVGEISGNIEEFFKKKEKRLCPCSCDFSIGQILEQTGDIDDAPLYSVVACSGEDQYVLYKNVLASDWAEYSPGDNVIVIPYNGKEYSCCEKGRDVATGCYPVASEYETADVNWRSTVRIIPWCGARVPIWYE